jgi:predicted methyltransferase
MSKTLHIALILALAAGCSKKHEEASAPPPSGSIAGSAAGSAGAAAGSGTAGSATGSGAAGSGSAGSGAAGSGAAGSAAVVIPPYTPAADVPAPIRDAVTASDRSDDDRKLDAGRMPAEVLAFFKLAPGQKIGELFAGGGYTSEVMARIVGDKGTVFAQNTKEVLDKFARGPWTARAAKPVMKNVVGVERPSDDPFPPEAKNLDAVITILNYHDFVWQKADRAKLNKKIFAALKKGGVYGIVDHSAQAGSGTRDVETLHRIDEEVVKKEVLAAGFKLDGESDLLRHPDDKRDWNSSPKAAGEKRGTSDRFTLRFVKP